jgi:hypothetical protein
VPLEFLKRKGQTAEPAAAAPNKATTGLMPEEVVAQDHQLKLYYAGKSSEGVRMKTGPAAKAAGDSEPSGEGTKPDKEDAKPSLDTKRADGASGGDSGTTTKPADAGAASTTAGA